MVKRWLRRWLERRQRDEAQVVIEQLRERVDYLERAFEPVVAKFPSQSELRQQMEDKRNNWAISVGQYSPYTLHNARAVLEWREWNKISDPK